MPKRSLSSPRSQLLAHRAPTLRAQPTLAEAKLWNALAGSQLGIAFRRQVVVGECIVDFLAPSIKLIVEVDGGYHAQVRRADARREGELERLGYRVIRFTNEHCYGATGRFEGIRAQIPSDAPM